MLKSRDLDIQIAYLVVGGKVPGYDSYFSEVCNRIEQYGLTDDFVLTGSRNDVPELISACDVVVHLPRHEDPFPGVVSEAMAMEKPVVAFASGGIPEQFENKRSGILVEKNNIDALAEALITLAEDEAMCRKMGKEARRFLISHFSFQKFSAELNETYTGLVSEDSY
jgi:glycosyltransferase involved in cell wall biosynthesis